MNQEDEDVLKEIILSQDIDFYHEYMENLKSKFADAEPKEQASLMAIYHATESVWTALLNLKSIIDKAQ